MSLYNPPNQKPCKAKPDYLKKNFRGLAGLSVPEAAANCAVGECDYITIVNSSIVFYNKKSNKINAQYFLSQVTGSSLITSEPFFNIPNVISDPWIIYDPYVKRFAFVCVADTTDIIPTGVLYFAISKGETFCDYLEDWHRYTIPLDIDEDYIPSTPKIGFDQKAYYITAEVTTFLVESVIYGFTKKEVLQGKPINNVVDLSYSFTDGVTNLFPLKVYDCGSPMYFVCSDTVSPSTSIFYISITNYTTVVGPNPITVAAYQLPPDATQLGGNLIETYGSGFNTGCVRNGHMWLAHHISLTGTNLKVRWYDILISTSNANFVVNQFETIDRCSTIQYWMPRLDVDPCGNMGIAFSVCDPTSVYGIGIIATGRVRDYLPNLTRKPLFIKRGEGIYTLSTQYGPYSGLCFDPSTDQQFWLINQFGFDSNVLMNEGIFFKTQNAMFKLRDYGCCDCVPIPCNNNCPEL